MIETTKPTDSSGCEIVHIDESDFRGLPRSVRMLILAYSKPVPSGQDGLLVFQVRGYRWPEIDAEMRNAASRSYPEQHGRLKKKVRYLNDYECLRDGATWSLLGCASAQSERCPMCRNSVKPFSSERYMVLEWVPAPSSVCARLRKWLLSIS